MPFLKKEILLGILKTYPASKAIEEKIKSIDKQTKSRFWDFANSVVEFTKKVARYNFTEYSEVCYLRIKRLIEAADTNIELWPDLICIAGEAGTKTQATSSKGSKSELCEAALALICYILKQVNEKVASIKGKPESEDEIKALKIHELINARIETTKNLIEYQKLCLDYYRLLYTRDALDINTADLAANEKKALKMIAICQRNSFFLGDYSLQKDPQINPLLQTPDQLFINMEFYNTVDKDKYNLSEPKLDKLKLLLPMYLQDVWIIIHIRNKYPHLKNDGEDTVIATFEKEFLSRGEEEEKLQNLAQKRKDSLLPASPLSDLKSELPARPVPRLSSLNSKEKKGLDDLKDQQSKLYLLEDGKPKEIFPSEKLPTEDQKEKKIEQKQTPLASPTPKDTRQSFFSVQETDQSTSKILLNLDSKEGIRAEKSTLPATVADDMSAGKKRKKNKHSRNKIEIRPSSGNLRI